VFQQDFVKNFWEKIGDFILEKDWRIYGKESGRRRGEELGRKRKREGRRDEVGGSWGGLPDNIK